MPGIPALRYVPRLPVLMLAPRGPKLKLDPLPERFHRMPGASLIDLRKRSAMLHDADRSTVAQPVENPRHKSTLGFWCPGLLCLISVASATARASPINDQLASLTEEKRNWVFARMMQREGETCPSVNRTLFQGLLRKLSSNTG